MRRKALRRARYLDLDGYITADEASAILNTRRSPFGSAAAEIGVLCAVLLMFSAALFLAAAQFGLDI